MAIPRAALCRSSHHITPSRIQIVGCFDRSYIKPDCGRFLRLASTVTLMEPSVSHRRTSLLNPNPLEALTDRMTSRLEHAACPSVDPTSRATTFSGLALAESTQARTCFERQAADVV